MMTQARKSHFVHISTDPDCWGSNPDGFDCVAEACRIRDAAEAAGIEVAFDTSRTAYQYDDDGRRRPEIEWFSEWCTAGYEWTDGGMD